MLLVATFPSPRHHHTLATRHQTAPSAILRPHTYLIENFYPLQGITTLWPHDQYTQRTGHKVCMDLSWHALKSQDTGQNSLPHWKQGLGYRWFSNKFSLNAEAKPSFRKVNLLPAKLGICMLSPLTCGLQSLGHKSTPSHKPWSEAY